MKIKWAGGQVVGWSSILLISWLLGHVVTCLYAAGTTIGDVLNLNISVRSNGLGKMYLFDNGIGGNPSLTDDNDNLKFGYFSSPLGVNVLDFSGKMRFDRFSFGAGILNQNAGDVEIVRMGFEDRETERYTKNLQNDNIFIFGLGYDVNKSISGGVNIKYLNSKLLESYELKILSYDLALALRIKKFVLSYLSKNSGGKYSYSGSTTEFPLPYFMSAGFSFSPSNFALFFSYENYLYNKDVYRYGAEWKLPYEKIYPLSALDFRCGYYVKERGSNFTFGFSLGFSSVLFEYALAPLDNVGLCHNVSMTYRFGYKTKIPDSKIKEKIIITFSEGKFEEKSYKKLEDIAKFLKENSGYIVKLVGHLDLVDMVMDYFTTAESIPSSLFIVEESESPTVEVLLISR